MVRGKVYHGLRFPCKGLRAAGAGDPAFNGLEIDVFRFRARIGLTKPFVCAKENWRPWSAATVTSMPSCRRAFSSDWIDRPPLAEELQPEAFQHVFRVVGVDFSVRSRLLCFFLRGEPVEDVVVEELFLGTPVVDETKLLSI